MKKLVLAVFCGVAALVATNAYADDVTFNLVNATLTSAADGTPAGTATGTVVVDTTAGAFVSGDIVYTDGAESVEFTGAPYLTGVLGGTISYADWSSGSDAISLGVNDPSLVGFAGGDICATDGACGGTLGGFGVDDAYTAYFATGELVPTPEPSSLMLLGSGLLGAAGIARRRLS